MRLTLRLESAGHNRNTSEGTSEGVDESRRAAALARLEDAARKAAEPGLDYDERRRRLNWLGGGIVVFSLFTGEDAEALRARLEPAPSAEAVPSVDVLPVFREGRSTPPPPRHPGAQTPVE